MLGERAILDEVAGGEVALQRPRVEPIGIAIVGPQCRLAAGLEELKAEEAQLTADRDAARARLAARLAALDYDGAVG